MNEIFKPYLLKFVLVFFDDILVYNLTLETHQKHLDLTLQTLAKHQLFANPKKCSFGRQEVAYLGHIISQDGVSVDQEKVRAMLEWPQPQNLKSLRGFWGLTG